MSPGDEPNGDPAASAHTTRANREAAGDAVAEVSEAANASTAEATPAWLEALMAEVIGVEEAPVPADTPPRDRAVGAVDSLPPPDYLSGGAVASPPPIPGSARGAADSATADPSGLIDTILEEEFGVYVQAASAPPPVPAFGEPAPAWEPPVETAVDPVIESASESVTPPAPVEEPRSVWAPPVDPLHEDANTPAAPGPASDEPTPAVGPLTASVAPPPVPPLDEPKPAWKPAVDPLREYASKPPPVAAGDEPTRAQEPPVEPAPEPVRESVTLPPPPPVPAFAEPAGETAGEPAAEPSSEAVAPPPDEPAPPEPAPRLADPRLDDEWD
ncbi:MAG: hypothetical protein ABSB54_19500 [Acidimicrobiales bacterium]